MKEIHLNFDLKFSSRFVQCAAVGLIVLAAVPELGSESVTLATYYPAPSGVYTNLITTGNTWLGRDGGASVKVNGSTVNEALGVFGKGVFDGSLFAGQYYPTGAGRVNANSMEIGGANPDAGNAMATLFLHHHGVIAHQLRYTSGELFLEAAGNGYGTSATPALTVGGNITSVSGHAVLHGGAGCVVVDYPTTGSTSCDSKGYTNHYVSNIAGVLSRYSMMPVYRDTGGSSAQGFMLCCPCASFNLPGGVCPDMDL